MNYSDNVKQINFDYYSGGFGPVSKPVIKIKITKTSITYGKIYEPNFMDEGRTITWKSETNIELFEKLCEAIYTQNPIEDMIVCDGDSTTISMTTITDKKIEKYYPLNLYELGLDELADAFTSLLEGLELPYSLVKRDEEDS